MTLVAKARVEHRDCSIHIEKEREKERLLYTHRDCSIHIERERACSSVGTVQYQTGFYLL